MNKIERPQDTRSTLLLTMLTALALMFLGANDQVRAQGQWTTAANGTDIYNTNTSTGNVGIGTMSPTSKLEVASTGSTTLLGIKADANRIAQIGFYHGGTDLWYLSSRGTADAPNNRFSVFSNTGGYVERLSILNNGNIGIGTTSPRGLLDVAGGGNYAIVGATGASGVGAVLSGSAGTSMLTNGAYLNAGATSFNTVDSSKPSAGIEIAGQDIYFRSFTAAVNPAITAELLFLKGSNGNVGIGTTDPTYKLDVRGTAHVTGDMTVDGNISAKYQDVAEWVPATHALPSGTVVVLNPAKSNEVMASEKPYDTRVAGVVSERPGLALGEAGKDKVLVATTGRVKVKVNATRAPIHVGDLLVTSDKEGVAMKSEPVDLNGVKLHRPGTLIGKALEPLEKGMGEILVLLSLQ